MQSLRRWAEGYLPYQAAVELLCGSTVRNKIIPVVTSRDEELVWIDLPGGVERVNSSPLSGGERRVALLVLELAEVDTGVPVSDLLAGIDDRNTAAFLNACAISAGWPERGIGAKVTGRFPKGGVDGE